jgi:hypothetical protein
MSKTKAESDPNAQSEEPGDERIGVAFRASIVVFVIATLLGGGFAWWYRSLATEPVIHRTELSLPTKRELPSVVIPQIPFVDITKEAGIDFVHENGAYGDKLLPETMGSGCAFLDYDDDGDQDLLLVNSQRWPWDSRENTTPATLKLYRNDGNGRFEDVTTAAGLDISLHGMGVAAGDYDGDGAVDLFISAVGANRLFRNVGERFEDVTAKAGVAGDENSWSTSCGWFDYDNDGDLDLFVCNYVEWSKQADLAQDFQLIGGGRAYGRPQQFAGAMPYLYQNLGDGTFTDVSATSGVQVANPATGVAAGKSLGLAFFDFDSDGRLDVFVANDTVGNFLFHNQKNGTFVETGHSSGVAYDTNGFARGAMGVDIARFRNSEETGIAVGNFANEMTALYVSNDSQLQFKDDAVSNGLGPPTRLELTFGLFFADLDLDGRLDLAATNGHLEEGINRVQSTQHYEQRPHLMWNCGVEHPTEFMPVPPDKSGPDFDKPMVGRGAAYADIDADGDLDILFTASGGRPRLLRNEQKLEHNWLRVKLVGQSPNRDAIGAQVQVDAAGAWQSRMVSPTRSYLSQCELPLTFGLGNAASVSRLTVRWPSGRTSEMKDIKPNQLLQLDEPAPSQ